MLRSATEQGLEELVQCIETFQQESLAPSTEPPQPFFVAGQLPWEQKPHQPDQQKESASLGELASGQNVVTIGTPSQLNDLSDTGTVTQQQQQEHDLHHSDLTQIECQSQRSGVSSPAPRGTVSVDHSSVHSFGAASIAGSNSQVEGTASTISSTARSHLQRETGSQIEGNTGQRVPTPFEDDDYLNRFDDDESSDGEADADTTVLHVDDPRLAFGQSVYVGRRDGATVLQSSRPSAVKDVVNDQGQSTSNSDVDSHVSGISSGFVAPGQSMLSQSSTANASIPPNDSNSASLLPRHHELLTPADLSSRGPPLLLPTSFASSDVSNIPRTGSETVPGPSPVSLPPMTPTPLLRSQQQQTQAVPMVTQSIPSGSLGSQNSRIPQNQFPLSTSDTAMSSLGFSTSGLPLRASTSDIERARISSGAKESASVPSNVSE